MRRKSRGKRCELNGWPPDCPSRAICGSPAERGFRANPISYSNRPIRGVCLLAPPGLHGLRPRKSLRHHRFTATTSLFSYLLPCCMWPDFRRMIKWRHFHDCRCLGGPKRATSKLPETLTIVARSILTIIINGRDPAYREGEISSLRRWGVASPSRQFPPPRFFLVLSSAGCSQTFGPPLQCRGRSPVRGPHFFTHATPIIPGGYSIARGAFDGPTPQSKKLFADN